MDFDQDGLLTPESVRFLQQLQEQSERHAVATLHNMSAMRIAELGERIIKHCLDEVAKNRTLLTYEGALSTVIFDWLLANGFRVLKGGSGKNDNLHFIDSDGKRSVEKIARKREDPKVYSDVIFGPENDRVELKTSSFATPKERIPKEFFEKDIPHLQRKPFSDMNSHSWEGVLREDRSAEMAIFVCDKNIALASHKLRELVGDVSGDGRKVRHLDDGVTYVLETGQYQQSQILNVQSEAPIVIAQFLVLLAVPSLKNG